tara:strand:+ start:738 stop:983 length:246 start_codon:yes stop_codon:yes gene_type:complete
MKDCDVLKSFSIGDLVQYVSYYDDPIGPWKMSGDLGIVVALRKIDGKYEVVRVRWISDNSVMDMAPESLMLISDIHINDGG